MRQPARGFALAAVLWLLAGLAIVVSLVNDAALTSAERVRQLRDRAEFVKSALTARAEMVYFTSLATPQSAGFSRGDAMLLADETPYRIDTTSVLRIQDVGGLINLNRFNRPVLESFLENCAVPKEKISFLIDALEDYTDEDDLQRVNGAEKTTYALERKPPPRNAPLLSVSEVWQVHGWMPLRLLLESNGCARALTTQGAGGLLGARVNLATAPLMVLRASGVDEASALDVMNARNNADGITERVSNAAAVSGNTGMFGLSNGVVQNELRVTHEHLSLPWTIEYTFKLDPSNDEKPWSIAQPTISSRAFTPTQPSSRALAWPLDSSKSPSSSDANPVLPF